VDPESWFPPIGLQSAALVRAETLHATRQFAQQDPQAALKHLILRAQSRRLAVLAFAS